MNYMFCRDCEQVIRECQVENGIYCPECQRKVEPTELWQLGRTPLEKFIVKSKQHRDWLLGLPNKNENLWEIFYELEAGIEEAKKRLRECP